jgi:hypothetical protein
MFLCLCWLSFLVWLNIKISRLSLLIFYCIDTAFLFFLLNLVTAFVVFCSLAMIFFPEILVWWI